MGDSVQLFLHYDKGDGKPIKTNLPEYNEFEVGSIQTETLYGILHDSGNYYVAKYENETLEKIAETSIRHSCFSENGIYYQVDKTIFVMDYNGANSTVVVKIPDELYLNSEYSSFAVCDGSIWYQNGSDYDSNEIPLWSYDLSEKVFSTYNIGGINAVNNGYLYFIRYDEFEISTLWRFNVKTFHIEQVSDLFVNSVAFCSLGILLQTETELYLLNSDGTTKILDCEEIEGCVFFVGVSSHNDRIFVKSSAGIFDGRINEIDLNGNIIRQICAY